MLLRLPKLSDRSFMISVPYLMLCCEISKRKLVNTIYRTLFSHLFQKFFKASENIFRGSERRGEIDKAYQKIIQKLFIKIEEVAEENDKPPPEIIMFGRSITLQSVIVNIIGDNMFHYSLQFRINVLRAAFRNATSPGICHYILVYPFVIG